MPDRDDAGAVDQYLSNVSVTWSPHEQGLLTSETIAGTGEALAPTTVRSAYLNEGLLNRYLSGRRLKRSTRDVYRAAVKSFNALVGIPLEEAGRHEFREWYVRMSSRGMEASTITSYTAKLRRVLEQALVNRGHTRREARERTDEALEYIPFTDLQREGKLRRPGREKLVSPEEFNALMEEARHPRTRALVSILSDSGCRKGEILSLRVRDVTFKPTHAEIRVLGKTGERTIPLVRSVGCLTEWLDVHPDPRPEIPLFATVFRGEVRRMHKTTPNGLLHDLCKRAGLRPIHPHMFRHTRLTELAAAGVGEYALKSFAGWTMDSSMAARYIHLSGRAHIPSILSLIGVEIEEAAT